jgi:2-polyprenyl-3-methyl-5-hydroxy-6-metoxy-1,4-benzoquinol methylase
VSSSAFSDVDASGRSEELAAYLAFVAERLAPIRRQGLQMLGLQSGASALDVACGAGEVCMEIARQLGPEGRVVGIDLSEAMIQKAKQEAARCRQSVQFEVANVYQLPFPDQSFDVVRAERLFQHLEDPEAALREMVRVTRTRGQLLLVDPDYGQGSLALDDPLDWKAFEAWRHAILSSVPNPHAGVRLRGMMQRVGLSDVQQMASIVELSYSDFARATELNEVLALAVRNGSISRAEADRFLSSLEARHNQGTFFASAVLYSVTGRSPGASAT